MTVHLTSAGLTSVDSLNADTLYRKNYCPIYPNYWSGHAINTAGSSWVQVALVQGQWADGRSVFQKSMPAPGSDFSELFYLGVAGGSGAGSADLKIKFDFNSGSSIAETRIVSGWHGAGSQFHFIGQIVDVSGTSIRSYLSAGSNRSATLFFKNAGVSGNVGIAQAWVEQRIYFT